MSALQISIPDKLVPVFTGDAMYRVAYGGRGSAKTRTFAKMAAVRGAMFADAGVTGVIVCGREFMNSLDESSLAEVKAAISEEPWLSAKYEVGDKFIRTRDGRVEFAFIGLRRSLNSIKSKSRILILWVDEAEEVSESAWIVVDPTVREEESEIWVTWNPKRKNSATHKRFRVDAPPKSKIAQMNWRDNPWFPEVLNQKRLTDKDKRPEQYEHIWEGDFATAIAGAYFARSLIDAREEGRIGKVPKDSLMRLRAFWDLGGRGMKSDATTIWIAQFVGREIRVLDYYEAVGQPIGSHVDWLRSKKYEKALCVLPHDGEPLSPIADASWQTALETAGFEVEVIPNQGVGAARQRIEAARRWFPRIWFNEATTEAGRDALGWYHEKKSDDERDVGLGPEHDWSSHAADSFGLMCITYEEPRSTIAVPEPADDWVV